MVGNIGSDRRTDFTAVGDAVNVAHRLEKLARPGEILVSEAVQRVVRAAARLRFEGERQLSGREEPVHVYSVEIDGRGASAEPRSPPARMRASPRTARPRAAPRPRCVTLACTSPAERGERLYREGDRLGALEIWRAIPENARAYPAVQQRIPLVEAEFQRLVVRYKQRARYFESKGRLAESILNDRLALELQPDDAATLARVQALARTLAARKAELMTEYRASFAAGDLASARRTLAQLHTLDAFDPELETEARALGDALRSEVSKQIAMGRRGFASGNFNAAQRAFEAVLELDPDNESAQGYISYIDTLRHERNRSGQDGRVGASSNPETPSRRRRRSAPRASTRTGSPRRAGAITTRRSASSSSPSARTPSTPARSRSWLGCAGSSPPRSRSGSRAGAWPSATRTCSRPSTSGAWRCWSIPRTSARAPTSATPSASSRTSSACGRSPTPPARVE